jgi:hypothetical protein
MIFRVYEHYEEPIQEQQDVCFICFEYLKDNENMPTNLFKQQIYLNNCNCNGSVHNICLKSWFDIYNSCPICRINVIENNSASIIIYNYFPFGLKIYSFIKHTTIRTAKILLFLFFLYTLQDFYLLITTTIFIPYKDFDYNWDPFPNEYCNESNYNIN